MAFEGSGCSRHLRTSSTLSQRPWMWNPRAGSGEEISPAVSSSSRVYHRATSEGELQFVAVIVLVFAAQDGTYRGKFHASDAAQVVFDFLLFVVQLPAVLHVLPAAASAHPEVGAGRFGAFFGKGQQAFHASFVVAGRLFGDPNVHRVAGNGSLDQHRTAVFGVCDGFSPGGGGG